MTHSMRVLISLLVLTLTTIGLPGLLSIERTAAAASAHHPTAQGRGKKRPKPRKANKAEKKPVAEKKADKKKNDRGFEL
jgi:hypothetical protein